MDRKEIMDVLSRSSKYILVAMAALGKANEGILQAWQEFEKRDIRAEKTSGGVVTERNGLKEKHGS
jgi:hypothetical protein